MEVALNFQSGTPLETGWYLAAVSFDETNPDYLITLTLWYNPASWGVWWHGCGIGGKEGIDYHRSHALKGDWGETYAVVRYWAKMPRIVPV